MILQKMLSLGQESGRELPTMQSTNRPLFFLGCHLLAVSLGATQQTRIFGYEKAFSFRVDSRHNVHASNSVYENCVTLPRPTHFETQSSDTFRAKWFLTGQVLRPWTARPQRSCYSLTTLIILQLLKNQI